MYPSGNWHAVNFIKWRDWQWVLICKKPFWAFRILLKTDSVVEGQKCIFHIIQPTLQIRIQYRTLWRKLRRRAIHTACHVTLLLTLPTEFQYGLNIVLSHYTRSCCHKHALSNNYISEMGKAVSAKHKCIIIDISTAPWRRMGEWMYRSTFS
jgi:hypothetical protein